MAALEALLFDRLIIVFLCILTCIQRNEIQPRIQLQLNAPMSDGLPSRVNSLYTIVTSMLLFQAQSNMHILIQNVMPVSKAFSLRN